MWDDQSMTEAASHRGAQMGLPMVMKMYDAVILQIIKFVSNRKKFKVTGST